MQARAGCRCLAPQPGMFLAITRQDLAAADRVAWAPGLVALAAPVRYS